MYLEQLRSVHESVPSGAYKELAKWTVADFPYEEKHNSSRDLVHNKTTGSSELHARQGLEELVTMVDIVVTGHNGFCVSRVWTRRAFHVRRRGRGNLPPKNRTFTTIVARRRFSLLTRVITSIPLARYCRWACSQIFTKLAKHVFLLVVELIKQKIVFKSLARWRLR